MPTLIVENGTGVPNANSYVSLDEAKEYHELRGSDWTGSDEELTRNLIIALESLVALYGPNFRSKPYTHVQNKTLFPRHQFYDAHGRYVKSGQIPDCVKHTQCELALMHSQDIDLFPIANTAQNISSESVTVGPISETISYSTAVSSESYPGFRKIDLLIAPMLNGKTNASFRLGL
ncbi:DnaT-like ssDNA-binding protein [Acidovorax sp. M14]|uniref:DnaT-like ssDNA-binding protein n=1 Tax=Acidovorax sp. M14 TaxID=3411354 RepID=UPI003BF4FC62